MQILESHPRSTEAGASAGPVGYALTGRGPSALGKNSRVQSVLPRTVLGSLLKSEQLTWEAAWTQVLSWAPNVLSLLTRHAAMDGPQSDDC